MQDRLLRQEVKQRPIEADVAAYTQQLQSAVIVEQDAMIESADDDTLVQVHQNRRELFLLCFDARCCPIDRLVDRRPRQPKFADQLIHRIRQPIQLMRVVDFDAVIRPGVHDRLYAADDHRQRLRQGVVEITPYHGDDRHQQKRRRSAVDDDEVTELRGRFRPQSAFDQPNAHADRADRGDAQNHEAESQERSQTHRPPHRLKRRILFLLSKMSFPESA